MLERQSGETPPSLEDFIPIVAKAGSLSLPIATAKVGRWVSPSALEWLQARPEQDELEAVAQGIALGPVAADKLKPLPSGLRCINVAELISMDFPPREYLLEPIIPTQGLAMIYAKRGMAKTFTALSIAYAVASGSPLFGGWRALRPAKVLYVDGEMPAVVQQERIRGLALGFENGPPTPDHIRIITPDLQDGAMPNLATLEGQEAVEPFLDGVSLLIIDNLATLARHGRANDEESWLPVQGWLLSLRRRGIAVLIIHHGGKSGDQRGSSAKEDVLDTVIQLKQPGDYNPEQGARFELHITKGRGIYGEEAQPFEAQLISQNGALFWVTKSIEDSRLERIHELLKEGLSCREIAQETGVHYSTVSRARKKLIERGEVYESKK